MRKTPVTRETFVTRQPIGVRKAPLAVALFAGLVGGCQLIAGVHNDAELKDGAGGGTTSSTSTSSMSTASSSSEASTTSSTSSDASSSVSSGSGGCSGPMSCPGPDGYCLNGVCKTAVCNDGIPFDVFSSTDLVGHPINAERLALAHNSQRIYVAVYDDMNKVLLARPVSDNTSLGAIATATLPVTNNAKFGNGRADESSVTFQGFVDNAVGEVKFDVTAPDSIGNGAFNAWTTNCVTPMHVDRPVFAETPTATKFLAPCTDDSTKTFLIAGGSDDPSPTTVAQSSPNDPLLELQSYTVSSAGHLALVGKGGDGVTYYRGGPSKTDLATVVPFKLDADPMFETFPFGSATPPTNDQFLVAALGIDTTGMTGGFYSGSNMDTSKLAQVPPLGILKQADVSLVTASDMFGELSRDPAVATNGIYFAGRSGNNKSVRLTWLSISGELIKLAHPVFMSDGTLKVQAAAVVDHSLLDVFVAWVEQDTTGAQIRVRGVFESCGLL
jgi:hypothetical protein